MGCSVCLVSCCGRMPMTCASADCGVACRVIVSQGILQVFLWFDFAMDYGGHIKHCLLCWWCWSEMLIACRST